MKRLSARAGKAAILILFGLCFLLAVGPFSLVTRNGMSLCTQPRREDEPLRAATEPLIFVGGVPRSGTTLMRAILDAHPDIRCGEETRVVPRILGMNQKLRMTKIEMDRLQLAHIDEDVLNHALGAYILTVIAEHGPPARRLCNKDPFALRYIPTLKETFPNAKFVLLIRDGRATISSIITRKVSIRGFNTESYDGALRDWNRAMSIMFNDCLSAGSATCYMIRYEELVLAPREKLKLLLQWLDVEWNDAVLHHEQFIGTEVSLSRREPSTSQVNQSINVEALSRWTKTFPISSLQRADEIAPMLRHLGYDPTVAEPNYGRLGRIERSLVETAPVVDRANANANANANGY